MSTTQTEIQAGTSTATPTLKLNLVGGDVHESQLPQWIHDLRGRGWAIIPGAVPRERALKYADEAYKWLERWGRFDRNDPTTRKDESYPQSTRGGLYGLYGVGHEQFAWDIRQEQGVIDKFATIWGTDELLVSYDGINLSLPTEKGRAPDDPLFVPWAHVDQSPRNPNLSCVQGIVNLLPNGPQDGGLTVFEGSSALYKEMWAAFEDRKPEGGWNERDFQLVNEDMCKWLEERGCKWVKVCAEPGDLLVWDSRTIHYGATPTSTKDRVAAYVCYKPAYMCTDGVAQLRREAWNKKVGTTHDPVKPRIKPRLPAEDHFTYEKAAAAPIPEVKLSARGRKLAGLDSY